YLLYSNSIRAWIVPLAGIEVIGVAPEFVEAVERHRRSPEYCVPLKLEGKVTFDEVRLSPNELAGNLPALCICCGEAAICWRAKSFSINIGPKGCQSIRSSLRAPFCATHRRHWWWRQVILLFFLPIVLLFVTSFAGMQFHWVSLPGAWAVLALGCIA